MDNNWISVDDEMPEKEGSYLTYWDDGTIEAFDCSTDHNGETYFIIICSTRITHWMPLPDAPS